VSGFLIEEAGETREEGDDMPAQSNGFEASEKVSIIDAIDAVSAPLPTTCSFYLGRSKVTHMDIQDYVNKGYLQPDSATSSRPPGNKTVPRPKPYKAMVFRDFFSLAWTSP
jgi:hypothetical protein